MVFASILSWSDSFFLTFAVMGWFAWQIVKFGMANDAIGGATKNGLAKLISSFFKL